MKLYNLTSDEERIIRDTKITPVTAPLIDLIVTLDDLVTDTMKRNDELMDSVSDLTNERNELEITLEQVRSKKGLL